MTTIQTQWVRAGLWHIVSADSDPRLVPEGDLVMLCGRIVEAPEVADAADMKSPPCETCFAVMNTALHATDEWLAIDIDLNPAQEDLLN